MLTPKHYERSILAAEAADFPHYASVLRSHYALDFPEPAAAFAAQRQPPAPLPVFRNVTGRPSAWRWPPPGPGATM